MYSYNERSKFGSTGDECANVFLFDSQLRQHLLRVFYCCWDRFSSHRRRSTQNRSRLRSTAVFSNVFGINLRKVQHWRHACISPVEYAAPFLSRLLFESFGKCGLHRGPLSAVENGGKFVDGEAQPFQQQRVELGFQCTHSHVLPIFRLIHFIIRRTRVQNVVTRRLIPNRRLCGLCMETTFKQDIDMIGEKVFLQIRAIEGERRTL